MVALTATPEAAVEPRTTRESWVAHWRQVDRFATVEEAEARIDDLHSRGIDAVLSMIDGLCVLARRD